MAAVGFDRIPEQVTLSDEALIEEITAAYEALADIQKRMVAEPLLKKLLDAQRTIAMLKGEQTKDKLSIIQFQTTEIGKQYISIMFVLNSNCLDEVGYSVHQTTEGQDNSYLAEQILVSGKKVSEINKGASAYDYHGYYPANSGAAEFEKPVLVCMEKGRIELKINRQYADSLKELSVTLTDDFCYVSRSGESFGFMESLTYQKKDGQWELLGAEKLNEKEISIGKRYKVTLEQALAGKSSQ